MIIAIDAPLGFPQAFVQLLTSANLPDFSPTSFFENPLAFRLTERWVNQAFGKRPLSAPFDKLGNNAVVAIAQSRAWVKQHGFLIAPQEGEHPNVHSIIEVYPALVKQTGSRPPVCFASFARLLPEEVPGTDQYDAAICAVLAAAYGSDRTAMRRLLPPLVHPPADFPSQAIETEGWIYAVPIEWLVSEDDRLL